MTMTAALPRTMRRAARWLRTGRLRAALRLLRGPPVRQPLPPPVADTPPKDVSTHTLAPGRFVDGEFGNEAGTRPYKLYLPERRAAGAPALLVMLHGCTQNPDDFAAGTGMNALAEAEGMLVLYPGQTQGANRSGCWNWFQASDQERGSGEPAILAGMTREVMARHGADPRRVYVAGMSAGAAMALTMVAAYPETYAAFGIHSGVPYRAARDLHGAFALMRRGPRRDRNHDGILVRFVPGIVFHGDHDETVHPSNADAVVAQLRAIGPVARSDLQRGQTRDGHAWSRHAYRDARGRPRIEQWTVHGGRHAWSGGSARGTYTDPHGPDASAAMLQFFLQQTRD